MQNYQYSGCIPHTPTPYTATRKSTQNSLKYTMPKKVKNIKRQKYKKGKENHFEVKFCTLDQRLSSLVTGAWAANTFPVRKQLSNPHFQNPQTFIFLVFLTFSSNKRWWRLHSFSP